MFVLILCIIRICFSIFCVRPKYIFPYFAFAPTLYNALATKNIACSLIIKADIPRIFFLYFAFGLTQCSLDLHLARQYPPGFVLYIKCLNDLCHVFDLIQCNAFSGFFSIFCVWSNVSRIYFPIFCICSNSI